MKRLWAITCYFNPMRYARRLRNYREFRRRLNVPLVTVELAYDDDFDLRPDAAEALVQLKGGHILWQKERLLNVALANLPPDCDSVAWLDCDVIFEHDDWAERASRALDRFPLLQPFRRVYEPAPDASDCWRKSPSAIPFRGIRPSVAAAARFGESLAHGLAAGTVTSDILQGNMRVAHRVNSGLAWVARRDVLDHDGFYDACIMGSGNRAMACAALGKEAYAIAFLQMAPHWAAHYRAWAAKHFRRVGANIGCIDGTLTHLWHGALEDRRYEERHRAFRTHDFNPATDIALHASGAWQWNSRKPQMHAYVADYFRSRKEDGVPDLSLHRTGSR